MCIRDRADGVDRGNLEEAFNTLVDAVTEAGADLAKAHGIKTAVAEILKPVEGPLGIDASDDKLLLFAPEGGSLSGILRSLQPAVDLGGPGHLPVSYTHLRAHETVLDLVCRLLLEKKKQTNNKKKKTKTTEINVNK